MKKKINPSLKGVLGTTIAVASVATTIYVAPGIIKTVAAENSAEKFILNVKNVDEDTIDYEINRVLNIDCRAIGKQVLSEFINYVEEHNQHTLDEMLKSNRKHK